MRYLLKVGARGRRSVWLLLVGLTLTVLLAACSITPQEVVLEPPDGSDAPAEELFSVSLPSDWEVTNPQAGGDSWSGTLSGDGITLDFLGGPFAVIDIYRAMAGGGDDLMESRHVNFREEINGQEAIMVRPREGAKNRESALTGMVLDFPSRRVVFSAEGLSREEQELAFKVFRSVKQ